MIDAKYSKEERALDDHAPTGAGKEYCEGEVECGGSRISAPPKRMQCEPCWLGQSGSRCGRLLALPM